MMEGEDVRLRELYWSIPTLQENIDHIRTNLKKTSKTLTSMKKSMEKYTEESHSLANQLVGFSWSSTSEDKENMLVTCGAMITQIARVQNGLNNALHDVVISAIDKMLEEMKEDELREAQKQAYSQLVNYNNIHRKLNLASIERDEKKQKEQEEKKNLEKVLIGLTNRLRDLQTVSRFDFTKSLLTWIYANIPAQTQMLEIFSSNKEEILDVMQGMERSKQEYLQGQTKGPSSADNIISMPRPINEAVTDVTKQGYLYQQNHNGVWKPRFVVLRQNEFSVFTSWKSKEVKYSANLMLSVVKPVIDPDTPYCFEIITQVKRAQFKAFNQVDYKAWMDILQHGIAEALDHIDSTNVVGQSPLRMGSSQVLLDTKLLNHLRELSYSNTMCVDCGASDPDYVCINNGALVCTECSTVHRSMSQISKVRSLRTEKINPYIVSFLETMTNDQVNQIYLEREPSVKISAQTVYKDRRLYIQRKYQFRQFAKERFSDSLEEVSQDLLSALLRGNYPEAVQFIVMGAVLDWKNPIDASKSLCHYVVEDSNVVGLWLLVLNDAPITLQDSHGNTPLHYAANLAFPECVKVLLSVLTPEEVEVRNSFSKTALDVARDHLMRAEEITDDMKEVVKVLEEFLFGPQEDVQRPSTPRAGSESEGDVTASPRSSEKKRRGSSVMDILKGMKERRNSTAQLKKSDKRNSKANFRTPEKTASPRAGSLKFDESPSIKYYNQDEVVPVSPTRSGTFAYGASPYKDVDFNDLEAIERASGDSPRRERSNSITVTSSPRKDGARGIASESIAEETNTDTTVAETSDVEVPETPQPQTVAVTSTESNITTELASDNKDTTSEVKVEIQTEAPKWRPVRTSSNSSSGRAAGKSESMAGSYRNNPYFTFRNSMRDQLEEFEAMERNGENPDEDLKFGKRAKEAPEPRRTSLQLGKNTTGSNADDESRLIPSPRSNKPQYQNLFATSKTDPSLTTNNNNTNASVEDTGSPIRTPSASVSVSKSSSSPTMRLSLESGSESKSPSKDKDKKEKKEKEKKASTPRSSRTKLLFRNKSKKEKNDKAE